MKITLDIVGTPKGDAAIITLTNSRGASVVLSSIGAGIMEINVPDRNGAVADVVLGYKNIADYLYDGPTMGKTPGRYANRICHGRFSLDGKDYSLPVNCGPHHLHGGPEGFQNRLWKYDIGSDCVTFTLCSPDGDSGYPGEVVAEVTYRWSDDNTLTIDYRASATAPTPLNMTNHAYWNLDGEGSGSAMGHVLQVEASAYVETDETLAPTGTLREVKGTPMDFTEAKVVGRDIKEPLTLLCMARGMTIAMLSMPMMAKGHCSKARNCTARYRGAGWLSKPPIRVCSYIPPTGLRAVHQRGGTEPTTRIMRL